MIEDEVCKEFYVYVYRNPFKDGEIFYVGKGSGDRLFDHIKDAKNKNSKDRNLHKIRTIRKILEGGAEPTIEIVDSALDEETAYELEMFLISEIGRADKGLGPLVNLTDGGEGAVGIDRSGEKNPNYGKHGLCSSFGGKKHTEETRKKISEAQKGRVFSEEHKVKMRKPKSEAGRAAIAKARLESTYRPSEETKRKLSEALKGRPSSMKGRVHSEGARLKISLAQKGVPKPRVECPHCTKMVAINAAYRWHFDNCKEKENGDAS